jgi:hypothetical protein
MVAHNCDFSYLRGRGKKILSLMQARAKLNDLIAKTKCQKMRVEDSWVCGSSGRVLA